MMKAVSGLFSFQGSQNGMKCPFYNGFKTLRVRFHAPLPYKEGRRLWKRQAFIRTDLLDFVRTLSVTLMVQLAVE